MMAVTHNKILLLVLVLCGYVLCQRVIENNGEDGVTMANIIEEVEDRLTRQISERLYRELSEEFKGKLQCCRGLQKELHFEQTKRIKLEEKVDECISSLQELKTSPYVKSTSPETVLETSATTRRSRSPWKKRRLSTSTTSATTSARKATRATTTSTTTKATSRERTTTGKTTTPPSTTVSTTTTTTTTTTSRPAVPIVCPSGFSKFMNHCYMFELEKKDWSKAKGACRRRGGYLVSVNTAREQEYLAKQIRKRHSTERDDDFWLGMMSTPQGLVWTDGTVVAYSAWNVGPPECIDKGCKAYLSEGKGFKWEGARRSYKFNFICEIGTP